MRRFNTFAPMPQTRGTSLGTLMAAAIAACLPNPRKFNAGAPSAYVLKRQAAILRQMSFWGGRLDYEMKDEEE